MARTIAILLDGTSNSITRKRTNILRLYGCLSKSEDQVVYYDPGVGAMFDPDGWSRIRQKVGEAVGLAFGHGADANVKEAYRFLVETCAARPKDAEPDRICIFGFSRGAYTARMLAGFIHEIGLIEPRNLNLVDYAYRAYKRIKPGIPGARLSKSQQAAFDQARAAAGLYNNVLRAPHPTIHLLGLFDTVSSVIEPSEGLLPQRRHHASTSANPSVRHVRHAVAMDERRRMFTALLWPEGGEGPDGTQDAKEVWFPGVHCDVGGGYPETEAGLAKTALAWMIEETRALGLSYDDHVVEKLVHGAGTPEDPRQPASHTAAVHDSLGPKWKPLEYLPFPIGGPAWAMTRGAARPIPDGARIHASVIAGDKGRAPGTPPSPWPPNRPAGDPSTWRLEGDPADFA
ncbi:T6SS phospholipase effector Tle1-like catalytic domain-containing protein [Rhodovulum sp. DZ06]|uniref:T6SS phospholipase effector Tle1-like catalytic domain-containing protein n=1 Tax=Rhodovulum sp. DZ06 TaxID=3425126 RepID=UPI003D356956